MKKIQFSKLIIIFETFVLTITVVGGLYLAFLAITNGLDATLPWITTMETAAWAAYGFSAKYYYAKALAENTEGGITYDKAFKMIMRGGDDQDENSDEQIEF